MFGIPTVTIAKTTLESATDSVTLTVDTDMLSFDARHLVIRANVIHDSQDAEVYLRINADTGSNYNLQNINAVGTTETAARANGESSLKLWKTDDATNIFGGGEWLLPDALSTRTHKNVIGTAGQGETYGVWYMFGRWENTAAVTSVTFIVTSGNFDENSDFELCVVDEDYAISGAEDILTGSQSSFSQGSITAGTGNLVCIANLRTDRASNTTDGLKLHYNSDTTSGNYYMQRFYGAGSGENASASNADTGFTTTAADADANSFGAFVCAIPNYSDGSNDRNALAMSAQHASDSVSHNMFIQRSWNNTAGITAISLVPELGSNFVANSMFSLYRIPGDSDDLIERIELDEDTDTIRFDSIPDTYDHLEITAYLRLDRSSTSHGSELWVNDDKTSGNHAAQYINGSASSVAGAVYTSWPGIVNTHADNSTANQFTAVVITAYNYKKTDRHKHIMITTGRSDQGSTDDAVYLVSKRWKSTSAITVLEIDHDSTFKFMTGSTAELRGISNDIPEGVTFIPETRMF
tara:strand:+ start:886 stop:2454 length:1569 start_codon:yes stop_codon:yes gene_type:complete